MRKSLRVLVCEFTECGRAVHHTGLCPGHYTQKRRFGSEGMFPLVESRLKPSKVCLFPDCGRHAAGRGYCAGHYRQLWKGKPLAPIREMIPVVDGLRPCESCAETKPVTEYEPFRTSCRICRSISRRAQQYGISVEESERLITQGLCDCCGVKISPSESQIDHCHSSGIVRGVLCTKCNLAVGYMDDDPAKVLALAEYLQKWTANV